RSARGSARARIADAGWTGRLFAHAVPLSHVRLADTAGVVALGTGLGAGATRAGFPLRGALRAGVGQPGRLGVLPAPGSQCRILSPLWAARASRAVAGLACSAGPDPLPASRHSLLRRGGRPAAGAEC